MKRVVYGGSFNPPHLGHIQAVRSVLNALRPDKILVIPTYLAPHKEMSTDTPAPEERMELCRLAFAGLPEVEVSDLEMRREGKSYTSDTILELKKQYPGDEIIFVMGTDMILSLETWHEPETVMKNAAIAVLLRGDAEDGKVEEHIAYLKRRYGADIVLLKTEIYPAASTDIRQALKEASGRSLLSEAVYAHIIKQRDYGARAELSWLREKAHLMLDAKRIPHVEGCAQEAVRLARRWGADLYEAEAAGILHDITKKYTVEEQLLLFDKYGMISSTPIEGTGKILHQITGAAVAYGEFGVSPAIRDAIRWHTTGRADMSLLEKIIYLADYIEPTRDFDGVDRLRELSYTEIDAAMELGLRMTIEDLEAKGVPVSDVSVQAYLWFKNRRGVSS